MDRRTEELKNLRTEERKNTFLSSSVLQFFSPRSGLTLIELMVSAVILSIGMVLVARGLMTASSALQTVDNRMEALKFLDAKLTELQEQARKEGGLAPGRETGATEVNHRPAVWLVEVEPVDLEGTVTRPSDGTTNPEGAGTVSGVPQQEAQGDAPPAHPEAAIAQVRVSVSWQETRRQQEAALLTYVGQKAAPVGEPQG